MARIARVVSAGFPHHVTHRGNRRQTTFFCDEDYRYYLDRLGEWCASHAVQVWSYCLMPNHVHLIVVPDSEDGLKLVRGETHRRYSRRVNFSLGWRGHLEKNLGLNQTELSEVSPEFLFEKPFTGGLGAIVRLVFLQTR